MNGVVERALSDRNPEPRYIHLTDGDSETVTVAHETRFMTEWVTSDLAFTVEGMA